MLNVNNSKLMMQSAVESLRKLDEEHSPAVHVSNASHWLYSVENCTELLPHCMWFGFL